VSVINPNDTAASWKASKRERSIELYVDSIEAAASDLVGAKAGGMTINVNVMPANDWIDPGILEQAAAAVVQVDPGNPVSIKRFQQLAKSVDTPLVAAAYDPPLALVRSLVRAGAHDVIPLPISLEELETAIAPLKDQLARAQHAAAAGQGKLVSVIKSVGGVGATGILSQLAIRFAEKEAAQGRETCLIDLDLQFGDIAFQLGLTPRFTLLDLLEAGARLDGDLLRATTTQHASGLKVITAPPDMMPIEGMPNDHLLSIVELAKREFGTVLVDLPTNWTNWSLSLVAQSDVALLVTELTVASVNRAKRQLMLLETQGINEVDVKVVINRFDKSMARTVRLSDVSEALGRDVSFTVANDFALMRSAIDRGVPVGVLKHKSALRADLDKLDAGVAAALRRER
jgi:pilus assembly protein CpaE